MLLGLDDIAWHELEHAYGSAEDVPDIVRRAASADPETADEAIDELFGSVVHQGSVYSSTPVVLPFLLRIVAEPDANHRGMLVGLIGTAAEGDDEDGPILAVLQEHVEQLLELLADEDVTVREMAAYTLGHLRDVPVDRLRWDTEQEPEVRASILVAACHLDLEQAKHWLTPALAEPGAVQAAAAYLVGTLGLPWSADATAAVLASHTDGDPLENWIWGGEWLSTLMSSVDGQVVRDIVRALSESANEDVRNSAVYAAADAMAGRRSLPRLLVPVLAPLLADPSESIRRSAAYYIEASGVPELALAELAALATSSTEPSNRQAADPRTSALCALIALGDERWRAPVLSGLPLDRVARQLMAAEVPPDPDLVAAVRARLNADPSHNERIALVMLLGSWGPAAAAALPEVLAAMAQADRVAPRALAAIAPDAPEVRESLAQAAGSRFAAHVLFGLTGDPEPLVRAVSADLDDADAVKLLLEVGEAARPLSPRLTELMNAEATTYPARKAQIAAARVHWSLNQDKQAVLPTVAAALEDGDVPAVDAAHFAAELRDDSLVPLLRDLLTDEWATTAAARALWATTGEIAAEEVLDVVCEGFPWPHEAVTALVDMRATETVDALRELAEQDERVVHSGSDNEIIRADERLRAQILDAITALS